ncbi:PREDICTED: uncharacterized protein LOC105109690 [Populus euphratica]|uniref:Uncharacterized protein LOC105109690 n=1 Tax=Populus euphratica TaxID=75702 RepID=A0AAJ6X2A7_POPEU|nr:PREDICTED: uncharacterized protein LOC105109690 [Populus euphratica]
MDIPEDKKVKLVAYRLLGGASTCIKNANKKPEPLKLSRKNFIGYHHEITYWKQRHNKLPGIHLTIIEQQSTKERPNDPDNFNNPTLLPNTIRGTSSSGAPTKPANTIPPECLRRSTVNLIEPEEECLFGTEKDDNEAAYTYEEEEVTGGDKGELLSRSLVVQWLLLTPKREEPSQWHNIFRTRCTVNKRVCDIIIDSGSSKNIISKAMVTKLGLQTRKHPAPYKIDWIKHGTEVKVTEVCHIKFSIGKNYANEVTCDVVEMDACHIILGRPWQYDVDATYRGRDNVYVFMKGGLMVVLGPIKKEFASIKPKLQGKPILLVYGGKFMEEIKEVREIFVVVVRGEVGRDSIDIPPTLLPLLEEFRRLYC